MRHIDVILGSTRDGRFGEKVATWVMDRVARRDDAAFELIDLRDYPLGWTRSRCSRHTTTG
jgi:NAD(P)H-dependent FMN reductase